MKKTIKFLIIFITFFMFYNKVYAVNETCYCKYTKDNVERCDVFNGTRTCANDDVTKCSYSCNNCKGTLTNESDCNKINTANKDKIDKQKKEEEEEKKKQEEEAKKEREEKIKSGELVPGTCYCQSGQTNISCNTKDDQCATLCQNKEGTAQGARCKSDTETKKRNRQDSEAKASTLDISPDALPCSEIVGPNILRLIKAAITIFQVVCVIFALVKGMTLLIPPIISKDADALAKSANKLILFAGILLAALLFRPIVALVGKLADFDVSCITWIFMRYF